MKILNFITNLCVALGAIVMLTIVIWVSVEVIRDLNGSHNIERYRVNDGRIETRSWNEFTERWVDEEWTVISL